MPSIALMNLKTSKSNSNQPSRSSPISNRSITKMIMTKKKSRQTPRMKTSAEKQACSRLSYERTSSSATGPDLVGASKQIRK